MIIRCMSISQTPVQSDVSNNLTVCEENEKADCFVYCDVQFHPLQISVVFPEFFTPLTANIFFCPVIFL